MLTLGTGVGGGVVFGGQLMRGLAEFGHIVIEHDGRPCQGACTGRGHLEAYVLGNGRDGARAGGLRPGGGRVPARAARERGRRARRSRSSREIGGASASGIGTLVNVFDPELVVIGGGFAAAGDLPPRAGARDRPAARRSAPPSERVAGRPGQARHGGRDRRRRARRVRGGRLSGARRLRDADREPRGRDPARAARAARGRPRPLRGHAPHARACSSGTGSTARLLSATTSTTRRRRTAEVLPRLA